jgi:hypothetical protein
VCRSDPHADHHTSKGDITLGIRFGSSSVLCWVVVIFPLQSELLFLGRVVLGGDRFRLILLPAL